MTQGTQMGFLAKKYENLCQIKIKQLTVHAKWPF